MSKPGPIAETLLMSGSLLGNAAASDPTGTPLRQRIGLENADLKAATAVIVENHYLHRGRTMAQVPYWVTLDNVRCGVLLFSLPRMSVPFHGHEPMQLVELARMWLHPEVQGIRHISSDGREHSFSVATAAVGAALRRVRQDWHGKYPHLPLITACVSWADDVHHEGTIYRAANFQEVGKSGGALHGSAARKGGGRDQAHPDYLHSKSAFLFPYRKALTERQLLEARSAWDNIRPKRPRKKTDAPPNLEASQEQLTLEQ